MPPTPSDGNIPTASKNIGTNKPNTRVASKVATNTRNSFIMKTNFLFIKGIYSHLKLKLIIYIGNMNLINI